MTSTETENQAREKDITEKLIDGVKVVQQKKNGNIYFTCEIQLVDWNELCEKAELFKSERGMR